MSAFLPSGYEVRVGYRRWSEKNKSYEAPTEVTMRLQPLDTGSKENLRPNVYDFDSIPNWEKLEKARDKLRKNPRTFKEPKRVRDLPRSCATKSPPSIVARLGRICPTSSASRSSSRARAMLNKERDIEREKAVFGYMDGAVDWLQQRLEESLATAQKGEREIEATILLDDGKAGRKLRWVLEGDDLRYVGRRAPSLADASAA